MPCFVAYGIAKKTEDYIEAVYRWSTGAVELFWSTFFSNQFSDFVLVLLMVGVYGAASFAESGFWYYLWLFVLIAIVLQVHTDEN